MDTPRIPGFEILEALPRGGMSVVYKARQLSLDRLVALKTLPGSLIRDAADIEQFLSEARLTANLKHSNIVQVYDFGKSDDGVYYFVMEFVTGYSVASWIRRKGFLSETNTLLVAQSIAVALDYAWQKAGVIHCDIKPDNVIIDGDGTVKVADLGLAQSLSHVVDRKKADTDVVAGTPQYMAPEQIRGDSPLDIRADIYALGALMYHCLTGKAPFDGCPSSDIMTLQETGFIQDPVDIRTELSVASSCLVEAFMAKDRRFRHATWAEVQQDIKRVLKGQCPDRVLSPEGASTVKKSLGRDRQLEDLKLMPIPAREGRRVEAPVNLPPASVVPGTSRKTSRTRKTGISAEWMFAGAVGVAMVVLAGLVIRSLVVSRINRAIDPSPVSSMPLRTAPLPSPVPLPSPLPTSGDLNARAMLDATVEWARTNSARYDDVIRKFKQVADETRGTPIALSATEELSRWEGLKRGGIAAVLKTLDDKASALDHRHRLLEAAKLLEDYKGAWAGETAAIRARRARELRERHARQQAAESTDRQAADRQWLLLQNATAGLVLQGDLDAADARLKSAGQDEILISHRADLGRLVDQLKVLRRSDSLILQSFESQINQEIQVTFQKTNERLHIRDVSQTQVIANRKVERDEGHIIVERMFKVSDLSLDERKSRVGSLGAPDTPLLRGWLAWRAGDWPGAEKCWVESQGGLCRALVECGRERHKADAVPYSATGRGKASPLAPTPGALGVKPALDPVTSLKNLLVERNHGLTPEQIFVNVVDGNVVRLEIVSPCVRDVRPVSGLTDLQEFVCIAFKPGATADATKWAPLEDVTSLGGLRLKELNLSGSRVKDVSCLSTMPLVKLNVARTLVMDLAPLKGLPLLELNLSETRVRDLAPLQGLPIEVLNLAGTDIKALDALMDMPLKQLNIRQTAVRDLTPILNTPIERIWLDYTPIQRRRETDREFWAVLRRMPSLQFVNSHSMSELKERQSQR